jgi:hypothetical protein
MLGHYYPWLRPLETIAPAGDFLLSRIRMLSRRFELPELPRTVRAQEVSSEEFVNVTIALSHNYSVHPQWNIEQVRSRLLEAQDSSLKDLFIFKVVTDRKDKVVGGFILVCRGRVARVFQILCLDLFAHEVVAILLDTARARGMTAVYGRGDPITMNALAENNCIWLRGGSAVAHSRNPDILRELSSQSAILTGLAGETWSKLVYGLGSR